MSRPSTTSERRRSAVGRLVVACALLLGCLASFVPAALAAPPAPAAPTSMVDLGDAAGFAVLSGASVGNVVNAPTAPHTTLRGDLGVKPDAAPTGFPPGVVTGTMHVGDTAASDAHADLVTAFDQVGGRPGGAALDGALVGRTIAPGLHKITGAASNTGTVTLDAGGNPNAVFVIQVGGALAFAAGSHVVLAGRAQASRVFWHVTGAGSVGAGSTFAGTLMASAAVGIGNGTMVNGRAFARDGALTLDANDFYSAPPRVTIDGGPTATTTDTTPTLTGTTDVEAPGLVTVTVGSQELTATPVDGQWSVTPDLLANDDYPVTASASDAAGNLGSATQVLTVDTVLPVVALDGGPTRLTDDPTPTIAGTSDVAAGSHVTVSMDDQALTALVTAGGTWNVTPTTLPDGAVDIEAAVRDPAGNEGVATQVLTVDTVAPAAALDGGATALTNDATPVISGSSDLEPGAGVAVALADETLAGVVGAGGRWSVTASALSDGPHRVVLSVADAAGNPAEATQVLTVDTVAPVVALAGGPTATDPDTTPTVRGTSDAAPGTVVTVALGGQAMTTLLQADGRFNVTADVVAAGTWPVRATVPDPAGNVGRADQWLTIAPTADPTPTDPAPNDPSPTPTEPTSTPTPTPTVETPTPVQGETPTPSPSPSPGEPTPGTTTADSSDAPRPPVATTSPAAVVEAPSTTRTTQISLPTRRLTGRRGRPVRVAFTLSGPGKVTLTVSRGKRVVATLRTSARAGTSALTWNAKARGRKAPRGTYVLAIRVASPNGATTVARSTLRLR